MELVLLLLGVILGAVPSWFISRHFYQRSSVDAEDALLRQRLDSCTVGEKAFLVALESAEGPLSRYALVNIEYETLTGRKADTASNTSILARSVSKSAPHSLRRHYGSDVAEDEHTISLSDRGHENAAYLLRREFKYAQFTAIDDSADARLGVFRAEHSRDPLPGGEPGLGIAVG